MKSKSYFKNYNFYFDKSSIYSTILNPYKILRIEPNASINRTREAYFELSTQLDRETRSNANLAYDMICNKSKYINKGKNIFEIKTKDIFYYITVGDFDSVKREIADKPYLLNIKDGLQRSLLYLSARCGYYNITDYLLKKGINLNETQSSGSTPLHGASYYGQKLIVQLLIDHGAKISIKNHCGNLASDEARTSEIQKLISESESDKIEKLFRTLEENNLASRMVLIKKKNEIIAKKILCKKYIDDDSKKNYINVWHGTQYEFLESIIKFGLKPSGTKLEDGREINPLPGHINLDETIGGIKNWGKAIFVSPSIFYAANIVYAERIISGKQTWAVLIEGKLKPGTYTSHSSTVLKYQPKMAESITCEYRVECNEEDEIIYRAEKESNVEIFAIVFVLVKFLDNIKDYCEGDIVVNSNEERELLNV